MKRLFASLHLVLSITALLLLGLPAQAVTFTNDSAISFNNTNYDGLDIVVTNCTLTVDGVHAFASLQVLNGGNLTHSFAPNGLLENLYTVTNEPQVLSVSNVATLSNAYVLITSIVVQDFTGLVTYTNNVDYVIGPDINGMTTLLLTTNSDIAEGSTNLVSYEYVEEAAAGLSLTVTGDVTVAQGGMINADGKGYGGGIGYLTGAGGSAGSPASGGGGGHGGFGGACAGGGAGGEAFDMLQQPMALGSGGGAGYGGVGGAGGGSIRLTARGTLRVDGTVSANGANGLNDRSGGGAGGSIWLSAQTFAGAGMIVADGGAGEPTQGGGGGGGCIAIQYNSASFSGGMMVYGGSGYVRGGAGTVYTRVSSQPAGQVLVDNGGRTGAGTGLFPTLGGTECFDLTVQGGAVLYPDSSQTVGNLLVASNASIGLPGSGLRFITFTVTNNATIQAGGIITADGTGYFAGVGPGAGRGSSTYYGGVGGGGGYGGYGAAATASAGAYGGSTYGSVTAPTDVGSGGGSYGFYAFGGTGGGVVQLNVGGLLLLNGQISANGSPGSAEGGGGGSGGSVWLTVGTLTGAGTISANGGTGNGFGPSGGGGGGGGRIAIQYGTDLFFGVTSAQGGGGSAAGGAGTIYTIANNESWGQLLVDNGGQSGTNTSWPEMGIIDLTVQGGAVVTFPYYSPTIGTLLVASNGWVSIVSQILTVTGNATIQAGGGIIADSMGSASGAGFEPGRYVSTPLGYIGGGGGYGGYGAAGGAPAGYSAYGGGIYGSPTAPGAVGSGGGGYATYAVGGAGGGLIRLNVTGVLQVEGRISAAGGPGITPSGGGGSGGGIALTVGTLAGAGIISANGGAGNYLGGGGGGGCIAIVYGAYDFSGVVSAYGGGGYAWGGAGTVYTKANSASWGQVTADNGGQSGTNTSWTSTGTIDLTVRGGAVVSPPSYSQTIGTLLVASNGWVSIASQTLTVTGNATVQAGGGISADGTGYAAGSGTGAGGSSSTTSGGGGGHGGYGASGSGTSYANGGTTYGEVTTPTELGSGGGGGSSPVLGGAGGGAIRLTVDGTLEVDGSITARGLAGTGSGGGGAGGSIYLSVGSLTGSGVISANGGAGSGLGGGGGGGRIAVAAYNSSAFANTFAGLMSAYGGGGYARGGAGTIYTAGVYPLPGQIVVDNGGQAGTNTSWPSGVTTASVTVQDGAVVSLPAGSQTIANLVVASNGWLSVATSQGSMAMLTVSGNATIQAGGGITADGAGNASGQGPGAGGYSDVSGGYYVGGGGGNGGYGAASGGSSPARGGSTVGILTAPVAGSGGGAYSATAGSGGGGLTLNVTGTLEVDGRISAAGGAGVSDNTGGGAGGGITLNVGTLTGVGVIAANGGAGNGLGGGGGGGRIAITYTANAFAGLLSAYGGGGYGVGGAGTIYTKANSGSWGQVVVNNGGQSGTNTSWTSTGTIDLTVKGGAVVSPPSQTMGNLLVASNAWISLGSQTLTVTSNATVQAGGGIVADGNGYAAGLGTGAGKVVSTSSGYVGGGGGYGGFGAASGGTTPAAGGSPYGLGTAPLSLGSGGGGYSSSAPGGAGGGLVLMNVTGALLVNGRISANGSAGIGQGAGGGSGGGVLLTAGTLAGAGVIAANGGAGNELGGGGGGGCIILRYGVNAFQGILSAYGGGGYAFGGAGTIYTKANSQSMGQLLVDNGGQNGTNTPISALSPFNLSPFNLTVQNGAVAYPANPPLLLSNLFVNAGGTFTCPTQTTLNVTVLDNATIEPGGLLSVDGLGFGAGTGPGAGLSTNSIGSGAGHGGNGGASTVLPGGPSYDSAQQPVDLGSGGGPGYQWTTNGGAGGGAILFTVGGALTVNGRISAGGEAAMQDDGGGGSGGSVWLAAGTLTGDGAIAADGGAGELYDGGGGGGGRVALFSPVNAFSGVVSAAGAVGASPGQNGSVYSAPFPPPPQVVYITPLGAPLNAAVSNFNILFSTVVNPASVSAATVTLTAPGGVAVSNLVVSTVTPYQFQASFPQQIAAGNYVITVGPQVLDLLGQPMSQAYTGTYSIVWSTVQGAVTDTNGLPVPGVVLQPSGGIASTTTDINGNYLLSLPPAGTIQVTPSAANLMFVPSSLTYIDVTGVLSNQNYLAVSTLAPALALQVQTNTCVLNWYGISGVTYQPFYSTNLVDWMPYAGAVDGTNGAMQLVIPADTAPTMFFRMGASD